MSNRGTLRIGQVQVGPVCEGRAGNHEGYDTN